MSDSTSYLATARYGKDKIRVLRVVREGAWHTVVEYYVKALLEGDIDISYTQADNSVVVATDSIKNITNFLAKTSPHVLSPERFALHLGAHLVAKYAHIHKAFVTIEQLRWARIPAGGDARGHPHAFVRDGDDRRIVRAEIDGSAGKDRIVGRVRAGITGLLVLKSTGSAFEGFVRDEYTTLVEVNDRIFSTAVDLEYAFADVHFLPWTDDFKDDVKIKEEQVDGSAWDGARVVEAAREITLEVFAVDESASVQATLYKMGARILAEHAQVQTVTYQLPNKHYVPVDMRYLGIDNLTPAHAEVFLPLDSPSGLITATVARKI